MNAGAYESWPGELARGLKWTGRSFYELRHESSWVVQTALVLAFAGFTGLCAQLSFHLPFTSVPVTAQIFAVLVAGGALGRWLGPLSQVAYVVIGALGLPWFAPAAGAAPFTASGEAVVVGALGGYLLGFIVAAAMIGWLTDRSPRYRSYSAHLLILLGGVSIIYLAGSIQYALVEHTNLVNTAFDAAVPFVPGDVLKAVLAALTLVAVVPWADGSATNRSGLRRSDYALSIGVLCTVWLLALAVVAIPVSAYPTWTVRSEILDYYLLAAGVASVVAGLALAGRYALGRTTHPRPPLLPGGA